MCLLTMNQYFIHDARTINNLPLKSKVDLIVTSPPYFDMKDYGSDNQIGFGQTYEKYLEDIGVVFNKCSLIAKETASLWVVVDILKKDGEIKLLPFDMAQSIQKAGWKLRDIIIWQKDKTIPYTHNGEMRNIFEYVLYFTKTSDFKYYRERITSINDLKEWWQRYPERYSTNGKSPTNIWDFPIPLQGSWGKRYIKHFCPLPEKLIERIIHLSSDVDDVVLDPFAGTGAVLSAAYRLRRQYVGSDLNSSFRQMFLNYIKNVKPIEVGKLYENQELKKYSRVIEKLRMLKFAKKLYLEYKKKNPEDNSILSIVAIPIHTKISDLPKNKIVSCSYTFVSTKKTLPRIETLNELVEKKPLSKFGIHPEIKVLNSEDTIRFMRKIGKSQYWRYDNGIVYRSGEPAGKLKEEMLSEGQNKKSPPIFASINIEKEELDLVI